jgi:uncharacterized repeat protein (TIGR03809 family)
MTQPTYGRTMILAAHKWRDLAERRRAHFMELYDTGRWRHYYTPEGFAMAMRDAVRAAERWAELAPPEHDVRLQRERPAA